MHANSAADVPARLEALAALGGVGRAALHAQLAGAVQVVLHVRRDGHHRVLREIAVVQREASGLVVAVPAIVAGQPVLPGSAVLAGLLGERGEPIPW